MRFSLATSAVLVALASTALAAPKRPIVMKTEVMTLTVTEDIWIPYPTETTSTSSKIPESKAGKPWKTTSTPYLVPWPVPSISVPVVPPIPSTSLPLDPAPPPKSTSSPYLVPWPVSSTSRPVVPPPVATPDPIPVPDPTPTTTPSLVFVPTPKPSANPSPVPPTTDQFAKNILDTHNALRAKHKAPPLKYNPTIAAYANSHVQACQMVHSAVHVYGENLAMGTHLNEIDAVNMWYAEIKLYDFANPGFSSATGHFTQVVWEEATEVGCGMKFCGNSYLVSCNYDKGNMMGYFPQNVKPPVA